MIKRILLTFIVLFAMILPASGATKAHRHSKHVAARSKKAKVRKSSHRRSKSQRRTRASARRHEIVKR